METYSSSKNAGWLVWFARGLLIFSFLILLGRSFELSVIKGAYYARLSDQNRIKRISLFAPRGRILARGGEILVGNTKSEKKADDISITEYFRDYPLGAAFAHTGGYVGEVNESEVGKVNPECTEKGPYKLGSLVGRSGLEGKYECILRGIDGEALVEVDTMGKNVRVLGTKEPILGKDVVTNIDFVLQQKVAVYLGERSGAAVVADPAGEILAIASYPSFNPSAPADAIGKPGFPFLNRAIGALYHPGSVFKPVVALAGLGEKKIDSDFSLVDPGVITIGKFSYSNWFFTQYGKTEGSVNLVRGIARSVDTFFYKVGEMLGPEAIVSYAERFGMGRATGIDMGGEVGNLLPTPEWKLRVKKERWFLGNTYHLAIGQGDLATTPISINTAFSAIAADGLLCTPTIRKADASEGAAGCTKINVIKENIDLVRAGMIDACRPGGTGFTFFNWDSPSTRFARSGPVACKTGTAETNVDGKTHAWFVAFGPVDPTYGSPEIVTTVVVEGAGEGSRIAGPIARKIFDYWFGVRKNP